MDQMVLALAELQYLVATLEQVMPQLTVYNGIPHQIGNRWQWVLGKLVVPVAGVVDESQQI